MTEELYIMAHKHSISLGEQRFGKLKARFRCPGRFGGSLLYSPEHRISIINVRLGVILHLLKVAHSNTRL